jgi:hypothetical protein
MTQTSESAMAVARLSAHVTHRRHGQERDVVKKSTEQVLADLAHHGGERSMARTAPTGRPRSRDGSASMATSAPVHRAIQIGGGQAGRR